MKVVTAIKNFIFRNVLCRAVWNVKLGTKTRIFRTFRIF